MIRRLAALMLLLVPVQVFAADDGITKRESPQFRAANAGSTGGRSQGARDHRLCKDRSCGRGGEGRPRSSGPRRCSFSAILARGRL